MWVTTTSGFVSIVQDRDDPAVLQVRARAPEDITATFPGAEVITTPGSDYRYRARVNRREVADVVSDAIMAISYESHFKDVAIAQSPPNHQRFAAYYACWSALAEMQDFAPYSTVPRPPRDRWEDDYPYDDEGGEYL